MKFINLHQHTTYSFLDGYGTPEQIMDRLKKLNYEGCAITDHGNIYGHIPFAKEFKKHDKKLIFGCEFYVVRDELSIRQKRYFHITVLAKTDEGYSNLLKLVNISYKQIYYKPKITFQQLSENSKGLIVLSGCFNDGPFIVFPEGEEYWLKIFNGMEWYVELQPFSDLKQKWDIITHMANKRGLPCVVTFDCHYPSAEDKPTHDFMLAINTNKPLADPDRLKMDFPLHIPSLEEIKQRCREMSNWKEEWVNNSFAIAEQCNVELPKTSMIDLNISIDTIKKHSWQRMKQLQLHKKKEYIERFNYELKLIKEKNFMDYFWIIYDLMKFSRSKMLCGPGRGSSSGSLLCYLMDITAIDPLRFNLLFERFIDINRKDLPDIDLDFPAHKRDEVIQYLKNKYGYDKTGQLITFNTFKPKAIIQDAARVLKIPIWETKEATSQIIERSGGDSRADFCLMDSLQQYEKLNNLFKKYPQLKNCVELEGQVRQLGKHTAAIVIAASPLEEIFAVKEDVISIDKYHAEDYGLLKIDILGLETLDIIQDICKEVGFDFNKFYDIPLDDPLTYEMIFTSARIAGVFQFEGKSVRKVCEDIHPTNFDHLVHITALGRPGTLNSGSTKDYIKRFRGEKYTIDKEIERYTEETLGVVVYQEQVMNIVKNIGQFSWEDTSSIRKAMSKNLGEEFFNKYKDKFFKGAAKQGIPENRADYIWKHCYQHGCLSGDTIIKLPTANQYSSKEITIKKLYENGGRPKICKYWKNKKNYAKILSANFNSKMIKPLRLLEIYKNGMKELYKITLKNENVIEATKEHYFYTREGWKQLQELKIEEEIGILGTPITKMRKNRGLGRGAHNRKNKEKFGTIEYQINRIEVFKKQKGKCKYCNKKLTVKNWETHHRDNNKSNNEKENLEAVCRKCHKKTYDVSICYPWNKGCRIEFSKIENIIYSGKKMTYDIKMPTPHHNYIANDFIVHNSWSYNKSHAVSYALVSYWIGYCKAHWPEYFYARILKNKTEPLEIIPVLKEFGGKIVPLDINKSKMFFSVDEDGKTLVGGFTNIKGIGEAAANKIIAGQPYDSLEDLKSRIPKGITSKIEDVLNNGLPWMNFTPMKDKINMEGIELSQPIVTFENILERNNSECITIGKVVLVNLKDHNEEEKVQRRGYKMKGFTEFIVLKVVDDNYNFWHICYDKNFTQKNKQLLLSTMNKICLFKVLNLNEMLLGKKVEILEEK